MLAKIEITGNIEIKTGMHIGGSEQFAAIGAVDSPVMRDVLTKQPMIPGSSLKGKMRSLLAKQFNEKPCTPDNDNEYIKRLFGCSAKNDIRPSRLQFSDMYLENMDELKDQGVMTSTEIKFENTINRIDAVANPRQIERVVRGSVFPMSIIYNVEEPKEIAGDFKMLKNAFILLSYDYLGGHGSRGYGKIAVKDLDVEVCVGKVEDSIVEECRKCLKEVSR